MPEVEQGNTIPAPMRRGKNFTLTQFNLKEGLKKLTEMKEFQYLCYQTEICPKTKREHLQGFVQFKEKISMRKIKKIYKSIHIENAKGTNVQARNYCKKSESAVPNTFVEFGIFVKGQGQRTDIIRIKSLIDDEIPEKEIWRDKRYFGTYSRMYRSFREYRKLGRREFGEKPEWIVRKQCFDPRELRRGIFWYKGDWKTYDGEEEVWISHGSCKDKELLKAGLLKVSRGFEIVEITPIRVIESYDEIKL